MPRINSPSIANRTPDVVSEEEVVWAYRYILGREPESAAAIASHVGADDRDALRAGLLRSPEFLAQAGSRFPDRWVRADVLGGERAIWLNLADRHVSLECLLDSYEPYETGIFRQLIGPDDVVLDIGANIGWYSVVASTILSPSGRIHAFEPRPETAGYLRRTFADNGMAERAVVHELGVAEQGGAATLVWQTDGDNPGGSHLDFGRAGGNATAAGIALIALDELALERCDVIKIDVEGAEHRAMLGARELLERCRPAVLSELHPRQLQNVSGVSPSEYIALMRHAGYQCRLVQSGMPLDLLHDFPDGLDGAVPNVLFLPNDRANLLLARLSGR